MDPYAALVLAVAANTASATHRYDVSIDDLFSRLTVTACPAGSPPVLVARSKAADRFLIEARDRDSGASVGVKQGRMTLSKDTECIKYAVDVGAAAQSNERYQYVGDENIAVSPSLWLWRPVRQNGFSTQVRFNLNDGVKVSVPWTLTDASDPARPIYTIPNSPESDDAVAIFGHFDHCSVEVKGAQVRAAVVRGKFPGRTSDLLAWIQSAANNVALTYGRFPNPSAQVIVIPVAKRQGDDGQPVPFGHVIRNGGEAVQYFVNQARPLEPFLADWTATHEFSHLMIPYISSDEKWISEGLASYYQNVLMARTGAYREEKAWRKIAEGFQRGEKSVPHLSLENAMPVGGWEGIMKTYWGGAALFLFADVELRAKTANESSLDTVLERLQRCCLPSQRVWDGRAFFNQLDALSPFPVFERLYDEHRGSRTFPAYAATFKKLGLSMNSGRIRTTDDADLVDVRRAIMRPREQRPEQYSPAPICDDSPR